MPTLTVRCRGCVALGLFAALLLARSGRAEPVELAIQGALTSTGGVAADGSYPMGIAFYADKTGGAPLWNELFLGVPVKGGTFSIALGAGNTKLDSGFLASGKPIYVGVTVATDPELPREVLRRVPTSVHALVAGAAQDLQCTGCVGSDDLAKGAVTGEKIATGAVGANHVSFNWAAADSPGGIANFAIGSNNAKSADYAKNASFADDAGTAVVAKGLQCTGCVTADKLAKDVANAYLPVTGGTVSGLLTAAGGIDMQGSALTKPAIGVGDPKAAPCTAKEAGQLLFDKASGRLFLCDGSKQRRLSVCSEFCGQATATACGAPVTDGCGDANGACGTGSKCDAGLTCQNGQCLSLAGTASSPVLSCKDLQGLNPAAKTGSYFVDPDGANGPIKAFETWCDMDTAGGGWTLVAIVSSYDGVASMACGMNWDYKSGLWTDNNTLAANNYDEKLDHKYASYASVPFTDFLMVEKVAGKVGFKQWKMPGAQTSFAGLMGGGCTTLADAPVTSGGAISSDNALIYSNNLKRNCNSDYVNNDDMSRLHGNNPNNPSGNCYNGGWGLGVDGDFPNCEWASEARPQYGGWTTQCYGETGFFSGGELCGAGCAKHHDAGTFVGSLFVK